MLGQNIIVSNDLKSSSQKRFCGIWPSVLHVDAYVWVHLPNPVDQISEDALTLVRKLHGDIGDVQDVFVCSQVSILEPQMAPAIAHIETIELRLVNPGHYRARTILGVPGRQDELVEVLVHRGGTTSSISSTSNPTPLP